MSRLGASIRLSLPVGSQVAAFSLGATLALSGSLGASASPLGSNAMGLAGAQVVSITGGGGHIGAPDIIRSTAGDPATTATAGQWAVDVPRGLPTLVRAERFLNHQDDGAIREEQRIEEIEQTDEKLLGSPPKPVLHDP